MEQREQNLPGLYDQADTLLYEAETELNDQVAEQRWAAYDLANSAIDQIHVDNEDDYHKLYEYDWNIRQVKNQFRITKAQLVAERTNAELMVALKNEMNADADIVDIGTRKTKLQTKLDAETDATKQAALTKEIGDLDAILAQITADKPELAATITTLTARVTETGSAALTIGARIANEEAGIALREANADYESLEFHADDLNSYKESLEVQIQMAWDEDEENQLKAEVDAVVKEIAENDTALV